MRKSLLVFLLCVFLTGVFVRVAYTETVSYITRSWIEEEQMLVSAIADQDCAILDDGRYTLKTGWYAASGIITYDMRLAVSGDVHLILMDNCHIIAENGITVGENDSLTIYAQTEGEDMGCLEVGGSLNDASIGGLYLHDGGPITIQGGEVIVRSHGYGAGIGGGWNGDGKVDIMGGKVTVGDGSRGAGIGGGWYGIGDVMIYGGSITASAGDGGAAIGGGFQASGRVSIYGGIVTAETKNNAAAIGGGADKTGDVRIYGGKVIANTSGDGAAIGGGSAGMGEVTIYGGSVTANTIGNGAAIGGGSSGKSKVTVFGGAVTACANVYAYGISGAAIGNGFSNGDYYGGGSITLGWMEADDFIFANKYYGSVTLEKLFVDAETGEAYNMGALVEPIAGKMLVPPESTPQSFWVGADFVLPTDLAVVNANSFSKVAARTVQVPAEVEYIGKRAFADNKPMMIRFLGNNTAINVQAFEGSHSVIAFAPTGSATFASLQAIPDIVVLPLD